ncbi:MAG: hypothetical protein K0Q50_198 [Vampirovibrio sp.]|jgi:hypothetical protein|nr:hypothetical protein [Vampirovibrio sp.]
MKVSTETQETQAGTQQDSFWFWLAGAITVCFPYLFI